MFESGCNQAIHGAVLNLVFGFLSKLDSHDSKVVEYTVVLLQLSLCPVGAGEGHEVCV